MVLELADHERCYDRFVASKMVLHICNKYIGVIGCADSEYIIPISRNKYSLCYQVSSLNFNCQK